MQRTSTTPWWKKGPAIATAVFALMIGAVAVFLSISPSDSTDPAEPSPTTQAAPTTAPSTTTTVIPSVGLPGPGEPWDMLFIARGADLGETIPEQYAERAEQILGVDINLQTNHGIHAYAWTILGHIGRGRYPDLSDPISNAEIILLQTWPEHSNEGEETAIDVDIRNCGGDLSVADPQPPAPTSAEYWQPYRDLLDTIYSDIWALRKGAPTVLITLDNHHTRLLEQQEAGIEAECRALYEAWQDVEAAAAADHGAVMVSIYDILNGPGHDLDPALMGYLGPTEQIPTLASSTLNDLAAPLVVEALAAVGFEPWPMP